jgi:ABC-2 type transport system ATP-binding protein
VQNLSRQFGRDTVVQQVSFTLNTGEILGLLGHNGAGKSTTLNMITGTLAATTGNIQIAGYDLHKKPAHAKRHIGYLPATAPLYESMTVTEYLTFCAKLHKIPNNQIKHHRQQAIELCNLNAITQKRLGLLSTGFKQRVGIAQALIHQPDVIILDEPTNGLDPEQMSDMRSLIKGLSKNHSILFSSHLLTEVSAICDRVLILNQGKQVVNQTLSSLQDSLETVTLLVEFESSPKLDQLLNINGVQSAKQVSETQWHCCVRHHKTTAQNIIAQSHQQHWGLYHISEASSLLEQVFLQQMHLSVEIQP